MKCSLLNYPEDYTLGTCHKHECYMENKQQNQHLASINGSGKPASNTYGNWINEIFKL